MSDTVSGNISRLHDLGKRLNTSDQYFKGWENVSAPARLEVTSSERRGPHSSVSGAEERRFLSHTFDLMEKPGKFSKHPQVQTMSQTLRSMNSKGSLRFEERLNGTGTYYTFEKNVRMGDTFKNLSKSEDQRLYALTVNAGLLAHEATHGHYGVADEKPLRGKLSPPRVGLETMRSIRDYYHDRGATGKVQIVDQAIQDYVKGAEADGFTAAGHGITLIDP